MILPASSPLFAQRAHVSTSPGPTDIARPTSANPGENNDVPSALVPNPGNLRAMLSFAPLSKAGKTVTRALPLSVQTEMLTACQEQLGMDAIRDAKRLVTRGMFDTSAVEAWVSLTQQTSMSNALSTKQLISFALAHPCRSVASVASTDPDIPNFTFDELAWLRNQQQVVDEQIAFWSDVLHDPAKYFTGLDGPCDEIRLHPDYIDEMRSATISYWELLFLNGAGDLDASFIDRLNQVPSDYPYATDDLIFGHLQTHLVAFQAALEKNMPTDVSSTLSCVSLLVDALSAMRNILTRALDQPPPSSSWEIYADLAEAIDSMNENYLVRYQTVVEKYAEFFDDVNDAMSTMAENTENSDEIIFVHFEFKRNLQTVRDKWAKNSVLLDGLTPADAQAWAKLLGPVAYAEGTKVKINLEPLDKLIETYVDTATGQNGTVAVSLSPQKYSALQSALQIHQEKLQTNMQTLVQKYSTANSTFDNLVKVLSSTIASLLESDKSFLQV